MYLGDGFVRFTSLANELATANRFKPTTTVDDAFVAFHTMMDEAERLHIRSALDRTGGSVMKTSELPGISRKTLWEKMKKLRIGSGRAR